MRLDRLFVATPETFLCYFRWISIIYIDHLSGVCLFVSLILGYCACRNKKVITMAVAVVDLLHVDKAIVGLSS